MENMPEYGCGCCSAHTCDEHNPYRRNRARELGLPTDASWTEIKKKERELRVQEKGERTVRIEEIREELKDLPWELVDEKIQVKKWECKLEYLKFQKEKVEGLPAMSWRIEGLDLEIKNAEMNLKPRKEILKKIGRQKKKLESELQRLTNQSVQKKQEGGKSNGKMEKQIPGFDIQRKSIY